MKKLKLSKKDKIAYALIVLLGVIAFVVSTILLMEPKEAEAATTVEYITRDGVQTTTVYDIREVSWDYWLNNTQPSILAWYDNPENLANDIIAECNYLVVVGSYYFFYIEPFYHDGSLSGQNNIYLNYDNGYRVEIRMIDGVPSVASVVGMYDNYANTDTAWSVMYNGSSNVIGSTYDFLVNCTDSRKDGITRNNLSYPKLISFDSSAPYFSYKRITGAFGDAIDMRFGGALYDFYNTLSSREWIYMGKLNNADPNALSYRTELEFVVELPTFECLDNLFGLENGISYYEYDALPIVDRFEDVVLTWNENYKNLDKQVYRFKYPLIIEASSDGSFNFKLTYADILNYIRYFNDDARLLFNQYSNGHQALLAMFARIHSMSGCVTTTYPSSVSVGRTTYNEWGSMSYDSCLEVFVDYEKDDSNFDAAFDDAYDKSYDSYVGGLKDEIKDLQSQLDNYHKTQDAFGNLSGSNVFGAFSGIVSGLVSFASSVGGLSSLIGSVFGFLPTPFAGFIGFSVLAIVVIAIIKAIRG